MKSFRGLYACSESFWWARAVVARILFFHANFLYITASYATQSETKPVEAQGPSNKGTLTQWHAFGSGCRASSEKPGGFQVRSISDASGIIIHFEPHEFGLALKKGLKGVRECALRLAIEPAKNFKIKTLRARTLLEATKSDGDRLRSRVLLLLGDSLIARHEWDIQKNEFAKHRDEEAIIYPEPVALELFKKNQCGKTQIVGLDFTFEGVRGEHHKTKVTDEKRIGTEREGGGRADDQATLRLKPSHPAVIEIIFEQCKH